MSSRKVNTNSGMVTAGFGAAAAALYAAPELNADVVNLTFSSSSVSFNTDTSSRSFTLGTTGGATLGFFGQYNDSVGKTIQAESSIASLAAVSTNQVLNASSFPGSSTSSFSTGSSGVIYIDFKTTGGNVGWFSLDFGGAVTCGTIGGQYGNAALADRRRGRSIPTTAHGRLRPPY